MNKRPTSITIIAWLLIVTGAFSIYSTTTMIDNPQVLDMMKKSPLPVSAQYTISYIGLSIMIISGIGMLKGFNWARLLYVIWSALALVIGLATSPMKVMLLPGLVFFGMVVFLLFRPKASEFFLPLKASEDAQHS